MTKPMIVAVLLALLIPAAGFSADPLPTTSSLQSITVVTDAGKPWGAVTVRVRVAPDVIGTQIASVDVTTADGTKMTVPKEDLKWSHMNFGSVTVAGDAEKLQVTLRDLGAEWVTMTHLREIQSHFAYRQVLLVFAAGKFVKRTDDTVIVRQPYAVPTDSNPTDSNNGWTGGREDPPATQPKK
jgi:hypothetical protein